MIFPIPSNLDRAGDGVADDSRSVRKPCYVPTSGVIKNHGDISAAGELTTTILEMLVGHTTPLFLSVTAWKTMPFRINFQILVRPTYRS